MEANARETASPSVSGLSLLVAWANEQDHWIRALVGGIIETRRPLSDARVDHFYNLLLREKELKEGGSVHVAPLAASGTPGGPAVSLVLASLKHLENVNALARDQEIEFNPRMTVLFGENASGKTGYVRILKQVAAVRTAETILPNIHAPGTGAAPHATISYRLGDEPRTVDWHGEKGIDTLTRIDVFDARAAVVHVTEDLTYSYTPADLALFPLVHDGIERVHTKLERARQDTAPRGNPFLNRFPRESRLYARIEALGASTDLAEVERLSQVTPEEESAVPGLRATVDALRSGTVRDRLQVAVRERDLYKRVAQVVGTMQRFDRDAYHGAIAGLREADSAHTRARRDAFAGDAIPGVLGEQWRGFIEAAEEYIREAGLAPYPAGGEPCIYCRQQLGDAAVALVRKYRDYCNDALRRGVDEAQAKVQSLTAEVAGLSLDALADEVEKIVEGVEDPSKLPPAMTRLRAVL